ncbi:hypothetical protein AB1Y20_010070 [Prymnesium parvum]|uniref:Uncharacterized protein n=1 Tax=Prymnesium parvum TaxID=97485 RepID=A0AB34K6D2_PRYPA
MVVLSSDDEENPQPPAARARRTVSRPLAPLLPAPAPPRRAPGPKKDPPTDDSLCRAFLRARAADVPRRTFPLGAPRRETVRCGRAIKSQRAWEGLWPPLREILQNSVDHLGLASKGALHPAVALHREEAGGTTTLRFVCASVEVCRIVASRDMLQITQQYTFPLHPRTLDSGVEDASKRKGCAGGFGDGFKSAMAALLARPGGEASELRWQFFCGEREVNWTFTGAPRAAVATLAAARVLQVEIETREAAPGAPEGHVMVQTYGVKGVGDAFLSQAVRRFQVFWPRREAAPGVYVRGIWVKPPPVEGAVLSFWGELEVSGRERNDVEAEALLEATVRVLRRAERSAVRALLLPVREAGSEQTWLTRPSGSRFLNNLLALAPDFFRHEVFEFPKGALFVSKRTTQSQDPFIKWASDFLAQLGAPIFPLEPKANKHLFCEVSEEELEERCVAELLRTKEAPPQTVAVKASIDKIFAWLKVRQRFKVHFSSRVGVAFVSRRGGHAFLPVAPLTRGLLLRLLSAVQQKLETYDEAFTFVQQALFEVAVGGMSREVSAAEVEALLGRAGQVRTEAKAFLAAPVDRRREAAEKEKEAQKKKRGEEGGGKKGKKRRGEASSGGARAGLEEQIANSIRSMRHTASLQGGEFDADASDSAEACLKPASPLTAAQVCEGAGGGSLLADSASFALLAGGMGKAQQAHLKAAREAFARAQQLLCRALTLSPMAAQVVDAAYDGANSEYAGFCSGGRVVVNLFPLVAGLRPTATLPAETAHGVALTLCHELAHLSRPTDGHAAAWREANDALVHQLLLHCAPNPFAFAAGCRCRE